MQAEAPKQVQTHEQRAELAKLNHLIARAPHFAAVEPTEQGVIRALWRTARHTPAHSVLDPGDCTRLITKGWAAWLRYGDAGRRQIFLFLMPGDFIVPGLFQLQCCDLVCLTPLRTVNAASLVQCADTHTPHTAAMIADSGRYYRMLLLDHLTRLTAGCTSRSVAHLLAELHARALRSGDCIDGRFSLPIGQRVLASALGRSTVQVNKIINQFQVQGLIAVGYDWLEVRDPDRLWEMAGMTHSLLAPSRPSASLTASVEPAVAA